MEAIRSATWLSGGSSSPRPSALTTLAERLNQGAIQCTHQTNDSFTESITIDKHENFVLFQERFAEPVLVDLRGPQVRSVTLAHQSRPYHRAAFSPDGKTLMQVCPYGFGDEGGLYFFDLSQDAFPCTLFAKARYGFWNAKFSPDGLLVGALGREEDRAFYLFKTDQDLPRPVDALLMNFNVTGFDFSPDSTFLAWGLAGGRQHPKLGYEDTRLEVFHIEQGKTFAQTHLACGAIASSISEVNFSPDAKKLAAASEGGCVYLWWWQEPNGAIEKVAAPGNLLGFRALCFSPQSDFLLAGGSMQMTFIDLLQQVGSDATDERTIRLQRRTSSQTFRVRGGNDSDRIFNECLSSNGQFVFYAQRNRGAFAIDRTKSPPAQVKINQSFDYPTRVAVSDSMAFAAFAPDNRPSYIKKLSLESPGLPWADWCSNSRYSFERV